MFSGSIVALVTPMQADGTVDNGALERLVDFEQHKPLELESLFLEPLRQARQVGLPMPKLSALCETLQRLDQAC